MATQQLLGEFDIGNTEKDFSVNDGGGAQAVALTTGAYFITTLDAHIQTKIRALGGSFATATCAYSSTTGKITLTFATNPTSVTWTDTNLRDILGYTGDLSGAATYTATNEARYVWRPDRDMSSYSGNATDLVVPSSQTSVYRSRDGVVTSVVGPLLQNTLIEWRYLDDDRVRTPASGATYKDFQRFYRDVIANGRTVRFYPDTTVASYVTAYVVSDDEDPVAMFGDFARRSQPNYDGLWDVTLPLATV